MESHHARRHLRWAASEQRLRRRLPHDPYASVEHWQATRETVRHGGNGPDWEKCKAALDLRQSPTISSNIVFLRGQMATGGPYFMPGLDENYEKKTPK